MQVRIVRLAITPLLRVTNDEGEDLALVDGNTFFVYAGQKLALADLHRTLLKELKPEQIESFVKAAQIDVPAKSET